MAFSMTKEEALKIQAAQIIHYSYQCPNIGEIVLENTNHEHLLPGVEYSIVEINKAIPRGGSIEQLILEQARQSAPQPK